MHDLPEQRWTEPAAPTSNVADVIDYIAGITKDLRSLARHSRLDTLAYLLDMAHLEVEHLRSQQRRTR